MRQTQDSEDALGLLEQQARRQRLEQEGAKALSQARGRLVLKAGTDPAWAFFAQPVLRLKAKPDWTFETAATDGKELVYNPAWFAGLSPDERLGVVVHEAMHCMLGHHARRENREPKLANVAMDLAINPLILEAGFTLPKGRMMPGEGPYHDLPKGLMFEEYYARLLKQLPPKPQGGGEDGDGKGKGQDPGGCGGVKDPGDGSEAACRQSEAEWQVVTAQAEQMAQQVARQSRNRGTLPGWLERLVQAVLAPKVDWKDVLRTFVNAQARNDYTWSRPNRRFLSQGIYLPGLRSEELGPVVLAIDTSGSIGPEMLERFANEAQGVLDAYSGVELTIVYCDAKVHGVEHWTPDDGPLVLKAKGGGGTSHRPVFDWVAQQEEKPVCVICLTDLYTDFPDEAPDVPVLWAVVGDNPAEPPFGVRVAVKED